MPSGGNHPPANPAPISNPGALSARTDGGQPVRVAPGGDYGDRQALERLQQSAPMSDSARVPVPGDHRMNVDGTPAMRQRMGMPMSDTPNQAYQGGPLNAPSTRPGEPVTHGSPLGAGAGPEALSGSAPAPKANVGPMTQLLQSMAPGGATGALADLLRQAQIHNV